MNGLDSGSRSLGVTSPEIGQSKRDGERTGDGLRRWERREEVASRKGEF